MPRYSKKRQLIQYLINNTVDQIQLMEYFSNGNYLDNKIDELMDELYDDLCVVSLNRYGVRHFIPKSIDCQEEILKQLDDNRFKTMLRVNRQQFANLVKIISEDTEFRTSHSCQQFSIALQLAIVLYRLGSSGENATIKKTASIFKIGDGGTIYKITRRVFAAFLRIKNKYIFWPDKKERSAIVSKTFHELPYCIGYVDGTEIKLAEIPITNSEQYFSRKHIYSIKAQITCDYRLQIRHVVTGYPGSVHDATMFSNCPLETAKERYFSSDQWIAGDSAYSLSETVITPYKDNSMVMTCEKRKAFNQKHSRYRVRVENCIELLKERFGSLKEIRLRIHSKKNHDMCNDLFIVCCIIHNILLPSVDIDYEAKIIEDTCCDDNAKETDSLNKTLEIKRQALYSLMFE